MRVAFLLFALAGCGGDDAPSFEDPGGPSEPAAGPVRVLAVGLHPVLADVESQESFCASIRSVIDADVAPGLAADRPNLIAFPENTGLMVALAGERGADARAQTSITSAFLAVADGWVEAANYYTDRATTSLGPGQLVMLSVTDTLWRSLDCFAALAREHDAWIAVTYDVADAEQTTDPELVRILVDEGAADRAFAWVAVDDRVVNQTFLFDPEGELVHRWRKEYLVPAEEDMLALAYGEPGNLRPAALPFGTVASAISKDAWMPDVLDRLALEGTRLVLQPEAFSGWGISHGEDGAWAPDVVKESGWAHVMRYPELRANALPCMSANVFEMVFDCQSAIIVDASRHEGTGAFIGQDPDVGFASVAPWVVADDGVGTLEERRARLMTTGERLLPGSGDPMENAYVAGTAWADVDLGAPFAGEPTGTLLAPSDAGEQRRPAVAALESGAVVVVWEDTRKGAARLYGTRIDGGVVEEARMRARAGGEVRAPRLAAHGETVHLVWQERGAAAWEVWWARSTDGGRSFRDARLLSDPAADAWLPDVAVDQATGAVHVVFSDTREGASRIVHASSPAGRNDPGPARPVEPAAPARYDTRHNRWSPSIAARDGRVLAVWTDFRSFSWEIWGASSADGGATFSEPFRVDDAVVAHETLHSDPRVAPAPGGFVVTWTDLRVRHPDYDVRARVVPLDPAAAPPSVSLGDGRPEWEPALFVQGDVAAVAWQDLGDRDHRVALARSTDGGATFGGAVEIAAEPAWYPQIALRADGTGVVVFETVEAGRRRIAHVAL